MRHQGELLGALSVTKRRGESLTPDRAEAGGRPRPPGRTGAQERRTQRRPPGAARRVACLTAATGERPGRGAAPPGAQPPRRRPAAPGRPEGEARPGGDASRRDPAKAAATLVQLKGDADEALETLRDLARGIYPPLLADKGLVVALESQARKATLPVHVDADGIGRTRRRSRRRCTSAPSKRSRTCRPMRLSHHCRRRASASARRGAMPDPPPTLTCSMRRA